MDWLSQVNEERLIGDRRHIHKYPELSFQEFETTKYVIQALEEAGISYIKPVETGVLATIQGEKGEGKKVLFRADMDALPMDEINDKPYKSVVPGVSHTCGHDVHTAMLLETARILQANRKSFSGTVQCIFQPAEELAPGGALGILASDALQDIDAVFGMHIMTGEKSGVITIVQDDRASTAADGFKLTILGKGSHGSMPHLGIDPVAIATQIANQLYNVVRMVSPPDQMTVLSIGEFKTSEGAGNIIPQSVYLSGTVRTVDEQTREKIEAMVKKIIANTCDSFGATYELEYIKSYPAIINDKALSALAKQAAIQVVGEERVQDGATGTFSEDFSYYKEVAPTCFILLGGGDASEGMDFANHNPRFDVVEDALKYGVATQVQTILDFLEQ